MSLCLSVVRLFFRSFFLSSIRYLFICVFIPVAAMCYFVRYSAVLFIGCFLYVWVWLVLCSSMYSLISSFVTVRYFFSFV